MRLSDYNHGEFSFLFYWRALAKEYPLPICAETGGQYQFNEARGWKCDFVFLYPRKVCIEISGGVHGIGKQRLKDYEKWNALAEAGFTVLHFSPCQIEKEPDKCIAQVKRVLCLLP